MELWVGSGRTPTLIETFVSVRIHIFLPIISPPEEKASPANFANEPS